MPYIRAIAVALVVTAFVISGCGGSTSSSSRSQAPVHAVSQRATATNGLPLSREALIARADAICKSINARLNSTVLSSRRQVERFFPRMASFERKALSELRALVPPPSLSRDWSNVIASIETLADNTTKFSEALKSLDGAELNRAAQALAASNYRTRKPMLEAAANAGFSECAHVL
jgi:hypothetical protein